MDRVAIDVGYATRTGLCPVCHKRARAIWHDTGDLRITCGHESCFLKWLPGKHDPIEHHDESVPQDIDKESID